MSQLGKFYDSSKYANFKELGAGSYGRVYSALDLQTNNSIVIKVIRKSSTNEPAILTEVGILSQMKHVCHKNILCYIDFMEDGNNFYIITEYLGHYIVMLDYIGQQPQLDNKQLSLIIRNMKIGLVELHKMGVVHRDIKPENMMINPDTLDIKYIDFGVSCHMETCYDTHSAGTTWYMAPEILAAEIKQSIVLTNTLKSWMEADYWSLGVTILELVTGHPFIPFYVESPLRGKYQSVDKPLQIVKELSTSGVSAEMIKSLCDTYLPGNSSLYKYLIKLVLPLLAAAPHQRKLVMGYVEQSNDVKKTHYQIVEKTIDP
jgi:serine/threonine protein kinase